MTRYHSRAERAADLLRSRRSTVDFVAKQTGLPVDIVRQINAPIAKRRAEQDAVDLAERSMRQAEAKILREQYPCPLCTTGHAEPHDCTTFLPIGFIHGGERDGQMGGFWCHPYFCSCSNQRCIACNVFPSESREEAVERFCAGDFAHEDDFIELKTGKRYHYSQYGIEQQILRYLAHWSAEQVKRLGFDSKLVDTLAMQRTLDRMGDKYVDVFDTTLLCPNCGMKGEYRKAVSPITHTKTWWRVGCPYCKTRTRYSFPSQREAAEKFESAQLDTKPSILNEKSKL